ncbi:ABC-type cobalamin/Fe3+-siderophores transport system, ATPase component [Halalkaliarchaeum sp. AArc-CO]|uniref:ABC transporter ATP-binding protein n=1 Tax=unclassified Halalkaliarchaeum TaxID=2678344 RepID=UPI00217E7AE2|nr:MULTISPECIES: ABC transporter ATP-binding protein [unclassified Halalkaliarchaeum]MDR5674493.1 ABC transporter ATP-binding protein [Halalkaliarchaeum sp. AArc-GB]UWG50397.1 ABC-type cobalamin/Fe3+-siderophores transport system, ATPase component [Halalkaliarchaeum sp. AArc-CO]
MTLEISDLTFRYDDLTVLDGVDLTVESGEIVGLLGPNGSGKSTLLKSIHRIHDPDSGTIEIDGRSVTEYRPKELARAASYVPQHGDSAFPATVFETVLQGRRPHGSWSPSRDDRKAAIDVLERLDIERFAARRMSDLSGGQQQKVRFARALVGDPSVMVLDEPTSALDLKHQIAVIDLVAEYVREQEVAAIAAMHDLNLASRYCNRIALLHDGDIHAVGSSEILTPELIKIVYDADVSIVHHKGQRIVVPDAATDTA